MKYIHAYKLDEGKSFNDLELLTQLLSVLKLKVSTKSNIELYVDEYTLSEFKKFGIEKLYDEVNTEVLESIVVKKYQNNIGLLINLGNETSRRTILYIGYRFSIT